MNVRYIFAVVLVALCVAEVAANIGFEFETGVMLRKAPLLFKKKKTAVLEKGTLVAGLNQVPYEMQLDEILNPGAATDYDIEYVVPPKRGFPHSTGDRAAVCRALQGLVQHARSVRTTFRTRSNLNARTFEWKNRKKQAFTLEFPANANDIGANPQVTVGLPYDRVFPFFKRVAADANLAGLVNFKMNTVLRMYSNLITAVDANTHLSEEGKALVLFVADVMCFGSKVGSAQAYAKTYMTNLLRSNAGTLYTLLPQATKDYLNTRDDATNDLPGIIVVAREAGRAANCLNNPNAQFRARLFHHAWNNVRNQRQAQITASDWGKALRRGRDPLRGGDFESWGTLPATAQSVVFELRRCLPYTGVEDWLHRSIDLYDFTLAVKDAASPAAVANLVYTLDANRNKLDTDVTKCRLP